MEVSPEKQLQLAISSPTPSFKELLDSQNELFRTQIDQLQNIVVSQCKLTGVNPLSQEMAAGALSIKIGKRPRDLLNPKAVKYMQSVFSIKDAITKKESREISDLFGVTATQVREFFTGQRSRVRRFVRLSREKAIRCSAYEETHNEPLCSDPNTPMDPVPLNCVNPISSEEPSCSTQDEVLPGIDDSDKHFVENIFSLMRKEEAFSGQAKLMEWILQIENSSVFNKRWCDDSSNLAEPGSNRRTNECSSHHSSAKWVLGPLSLATTQSSSSTYVSHTAKCKQTSILQDSSIGEIMGNESWDSKLDMHGGALTSSYESPENGRKLETLQPFKLLMASSEDSNKKLIRESRERRKVLLVEQPGQKTAGRGPQVARSSPATQGRPLSADDIQKAKLRAHFMQKKYGKTGKSLDESPQVKTEGPNTCSSAQANILPSASISRVRPEIEDCKKPMKLPSSVSSQQEAPNDEERISDPKEPLQKKCKGVQIPWQTPPGAKGLEEVISYQFFCLIVKRMNLNARAYLGLQLPKNPTADGDDYNSTFFLGYKEIRINGAWSVGSGENSKEIEVQKNRIRRENEIFYKTVQDIPWNPKDPWDREMDYDDSLTLEIPIEQLPDVEGSETTVPPRESEDIAVASTSSTQNGDEKIVGPDMELLGVLLQNPELVYALTSGQGGNLSNEETVKLLDMIKANGVSSLSSLTGLSKAEEKVEVSLPSPTPSSNNVPNGWRTESAKNPFSRQNGSMPGVAASFSSQEMLHSSRLVPPQIPPLQSTSVTPMVQKSLPQFSLPQTSIPLTERRLPHVTPSLYQSAPLISPNVQTPSETCINMNNFSVSTLPKPSPASVVINTPASRPAAFPLPSMLPTPSPPQTQPLRRQPPSIPNLQLSSSDWGTRQGYASNAHFQTIYNNSSAFYGGLPQAPLQPGPPQERDEYMVEPGFESWSPGNSRNGWNYTEPRTNTGNDYRPERSRPRNSSWHRGRGRSGNQSSRDWT
ncbi:hypothetical protein RJ640_019872 [Escallonia rubra]|uniref:Homeobox domain-containing protein n=1 Tax=Escallonia rubra TaxID=112253 RepID=A0AA88RK01_9ASTE|nr:hypothetical protein RJ640_019872 [Escallonia rubra]